MIQTLTPLLSQKAERGQLGGSDSIIIEVNRRVSVARILLAFLLVQCGMSVLMRSFIRCGRGAAWNRTQDILGPSRDQCLCIDNNIHIEFTSPLLKVVFERALL